MPRPRSQRWSALATLFATATALALVASVVTAWTGVRNAASTVARGDVQRALERLEHAVVDLGGPPSESDLDRLRASVAADGVRWVAHVGAHGAVESGTPALGLRAPLPPPGAIERVGRTLRAVAAMHPPPHRPPHPHPPHPPHGPPPHRARPPTIVIEIEPRTALELEERATLTLGVGIVAAILVILATAALRRAVRERELARDEAARGRHLSSLGEMSAVLAHEIRNPLASLKGHAQLLEESLPTGSNELARASRVVAEAVRLERLTTDLLAFVRSGALHRTPVDPRILAEQAAAALEGARTDVDDRDAPARATLDAERIQGALENLLANAHQASDGAPVELRVAEEGEDLVFVVRDHGPGIPRGDEERIFEPFHTTRTQGTGLGLAVARRIAEAHGGTLRARTHPEGGAELTLRIPSTGVG